MQGEMFDQIYLVHFTAAELGILMRPLTEPSGGYQDLLRAVHDALCATVAELPESLLEKAYHVGYELKSGGWQARAKIICQAAWRAGWKGPR